MKRIFLVCAVLSISSLSVKAQTVSITQSAAVHEIEKGQLFQSKIQELDAAISRKNKELTAKVYQEMAAMMQETIASNNEQLSSASDVEKTQLNKTITNQNNLYREIKKLSSDPLKNQKELDQKLNAFQKTL